MSGVAPITQAGCANTLDRSELLPDEAVVSHAYDGQRRPLHQTRCCGVCVGTASQDCPAQRSYPHVLLCSCSVERAWAYGRTQDGKHCSHVVTRGCSPVVPVDLIPLQFPRCLLQPLPLVRQFPHQLQLLLPLHARSNLLSSPRPLRHSSQA